MESVPETKTHTPGPWLVAMRPEFDGDYVTADHCVGGPTGRDLYEQELGVYVMQTNRYAVEGNPDGEEVTEPYIIAQPDHVEDAFLIAACPDLLAACRAALAWLDPEVPTLGNKLRAAIAKATGGTP